MKEATARVMIMKVSVEPLTAAKGATSVSMRICFRATFICASRSCSAICAAACVTAVRVAETQRCTRAAAVEARRSSGEAGSGRPPPVAALLHRSAGTLLLLHLLLLLRPKATRWGIARWHMAATCIAFADASAG